LLIKKGKLCSPRLTHQRPLADKADPECRPQTPNSRDWHIDIAPSQAQKGRHTKTYSNAENGNAPTSKSKWAATYRKKKRTEKNNKSGNTFAPVEMCVFCSPFFCCQLTERLTLSFENDIQDSVLQFRICQGLKGGGALLVVFVCEKSHADLTVSLDFIQR